jgi:hypothetical protein
MSSPQKGVRVTHSLVICVVFFLNHCLSLAFGHCIVSPFRFTVSDYSLGILDLRFLITPEVS